MNRYFGIAAAAVLSAVPLLAQAQQRYEQQPPQSAQEQPPLTFPDRFAAANTTNDGCLTLRQAQRGLPGVAKEFPQIDAERRGCVTLAEIRAFRQSQNAGQEPPPEQQPPQAPPPPQRQQPPAGPDGLPPPPAGY